MKTFKQLQMGTDILLFITSISDELFRSVNIDDFSEMILNPQNTGF